MSNPGMRDYCRMEALVLVRKALRALEEARTAEDLDQARELLVKAVGETSTAAQFMREE